jgi:hypothetical protein
MDITGARRDWQAPRPSSSLRALITSGDFEEYWPFHLWQERRERAVRRRDCLQAGLHLSCPDHRGEVLSRASRLLIVAFVNDARILALAQIA